MALPNVALCTLHYPIIGTIVNNIIIVVVGSTLAKNEYTSAVPLPIIISSIYYTIIVETKVLIES